MHPTMIPFLTAMEVMISFLTTMEVNSRNNKLQTFIALVNHSTFTSAKVIQIVHTMMGNFCHGLVS
jgi:hypothetical protein